MENRIEGDVFRHRNLQRCIIGRGGQKTDQDAGPEARAEGPARGILLPPKTTRLGYLCKDTKGDFWNSFLNVTASKGLYLKDRRSFFLTDEMQFLEFIGLGTILEEVHNPAFFRLFFLIQIKEHSV